jgi:hypothetical protein
MPSIVSRIVLFLSSYVPLFLILGFLARSHGKMHGSWVFFAIAVILALGVWAYLRWATLRLNPTHLTAERVSDKDSEIMSYIATYLMPFLTDFSKPWIDLLPQGIFFFVIGFLYVSSNMIYINPTLTFLRYHVFEIETEGEDVYTIVSRFRPRRRQSLKCVRIGHNLYLEAGT